MAALLDHEKLRKEMKAQDLKQEPLAERLDISDRHLRTLCAKDTNVSSSLLYCNETRKTQVSTGKGGTGRDFMGYRRKLWNFNGKSPHFDGKSILFL